MSLLNWREARNEMAACADTASLRYRMLARADELAPALRGMGVSPTAWRPLGIRVAPKALSSLSGYCERQGAEQVVVVRSSDHRRRQRFTVAHEMAHLLMAEVDRAAMGLSPEREERLSDEYARRLLVPVDDLNRLLPSLDGEIADVLRICTRYDVSLSVALAASGEWWVERGRIFFAASFRGHPDRPEEVALRAYGARCGDYLVPDRVRLDSLGLGAVERALAGAQPPEHVLGTAGAVEVRLWRPNASPRSGEASGRARWECRTMHRTGVSLIRLDVSALHRRWAKPRRLCAPLAVAT
jgi:hypothetical protein